MLAPRERNLVTAASIFDVIKSCSVPGGTGAISAAPSSGDQSKVVAAMIDAGDSPAPPLLLLLLLGSDAFALVTEALEQRLAEFRAA